MFIESSLCGRPWRVKATSWNIPFSRLLGLKEMSSGSNNPKWKIIQNDYVCNTVSSCFGKWSSLMICKFTQAQEKEGSCTRRTTGDGNCEMWRVLETQFSFLPLALNSSLPSTFCGKWHHLSLSPAQNELPFITATVNVPVKPLSLRCRASRCKSIWVNCDDSDSFLHL